MHGCMLSCPVTSSVHQILWPEVSGIGLQSCVCVCVCGRGVGGNVFTFVNVKPYHDDKITSCGVHVRVPSLDWLCVCACVCVRACAPVST